VLKMCLSVPAALEPAKAVKGYALSDYVLEAISAGESPPPSRRGEVGRGVAENAKKLRKNQTEAEKKLWEILSRERMGCKFRRQHPIPPYVADFICLEKKLIIEADGGQHGDMQKDYDE